MFAPPTSFLDRVTRAARLVRAFALLEDLPASDPRAAATTVGDGPASRSDAGGVRRVPSDAAGRVSANLGSDAISDGVSARPHPHRRVVNHRWRTRRSGAVPARPAACLTPLGAKAPTHSTELRATTRYEYH